MHKSSETNSPFQPRILGPPVAMSSYLGKHEVVFSPTHSQFPVVRNSIFLTGIQSEQPFFFFNEFTFNANDYLSKPSQF